MIVVDIDAPVVAAVDQKWIGLDLTARQMPNLELATSMAVAVTA